MATNCAPLVADFFLFALKEIPWLSFLMINNMNIDNPDSDGMVRRLNPPELPIPLIPRPCFRFIVHRF